ncbi:MAG: ATP-binding protein [Actinomycetota bacterium]
MGAGERPPSGIVAFVFTDIEGSTRLLHQFGEEYAGLLDQHRRIIRDAIAAHGGSEIQVEGDGFFVAFASAAAAGDACADAQRALTEYPWPKGAEVRVRMGIHAGEATLEPNGLYIGLAVHQAARISNAGHGGQIVVSESTAQLFRDALPRETKLLDLGMYRLKDFERPERLLQLTPAGCDEAFPPLRATPLANNNIPAARTSFVGRARELDEIQALMTFSRLVTIVGPGGSGKTRLAIEAARRAIGSFADGVWLLEMAPLRDPDLVARTLANVLGMRDNARESIDERLSDLLRDKELLLILDNSEHLIEACASLADRLLSEHPGVRIIATSREPLAVSGEQIFPLMPLPVPETGASDYEMMSADAVRLFAERARLVDPTFVVEERNAATVSDICRRLDGIPLAIELAAARIRTLSPEQIDRRLDDRFRLLTGTSRTPIPRHQTLWAAVDWSYQLLDEQERALFRALSVFAGSFDLEGAEAVVGDRTPDVDAGIRSLVDRSMLMHDRETARNRMLETVAEYARARLDEAGEADDMQSRHMRWCLSLAKEADAQCSGPEQVHWLDVFETEHDNMRAALERALAADPETALRLIGGLGHFWFTRGYLTEGREWCRRALAAGKDAPPDARMVTLEYAGNLALLTGDYKSAEAHFLEGLEIATAIQDNNGRCACLNGLGVLAHVQREFESARKAFQEILDCAKENEDPYWIARAASNLGEVEAGEGNYDLARARLEEGLSILGEVVGPERVNTLAQLTKVAVIQRNLDAAQAYSQTALGMTGAIGDRTRLAQTLEAVAMLAVARSEPETGVRLLGASCAVRESVGAGIYWDPADADRTLGEARSALPPDRFDRAWNEGRLMDDEVATAFALDFLSRDTVRARAS